MTDYSLGPNGALIFANDLIASKLSNIQEEMDSTTADFAVVDTPGQIELFAFRESGPFIAKGHAGRLQGAALPDGLPRRLVPDQLPLPRPALDLRPAEDGASRSFRFSPRPTWPWGRRLRSLKWSKDSYYFEEALSKIKSGDDYTLYTQLFRTLKKTSLSTDLHAVSSYTRDGFVSLLGELSRIFKSGEEYEE